MQWILGIYPAKLGLYYAQVVSRFDGGVHAHTRWGSCSDKHTPNFTYRLCMALLSTIDYLVVHDLVQHIRAHGYQGKFYPKSIIYYDYDEMTYWTMGAPLEETVIINRYRKEDTYESRLLNGTLPKDKQDK